MRITAEVFLVHDTCNVYVLRCGREAVLIDFGSGAALDRLEEFGVDRVTDVLVTHHHRDQVQGLARAVAAGARVWVPPVERDLFDRVDEHWLARPVDNDYNLRQDKFSLLEPVPVSGCVEEYRTRRYGGVDVYTLPTPGHTVGSVSYLVDIGGRRVAFTGDLLSGPGQVWSLAATQWTYSGNEGMAATVLSCRQLEDRRPDLLLPSHGDPIEEPLTATALLRGRLQQLIDFRRPAPWDLDGLLARPWEPITPHLLRNRTSLAITYALLSESGGALLLDFGYDLTTGLAAGSDRGSRRPLLASIGALRRDHGVDRVEVAVPTHYHDDHVAGFPLLRDVEGALVWCHEDIAPVLREPSRYDLPCLWYDPIPVDRTVGSGESVRWREYDLRMWPLPGHTLYATAIEFEVDGRRVLATGDQQDGAWEEGGRPEFLNYQYRNRFRIDDFRRSAELYLSLRPDLMISGHWPAREVTEDYLKMLLLQGEELARMHRELLPLDQVDFDAGGFGARIEPYRSTVRARQAVRLDVTVRNPFPGPDVAMVTLVVPQGWMVEPPHRELTLPGRGEAVASFGVTAPAGTSVRRARVAADLTVGRVRFGQQAEALVSVL